MKYILIILLSILLINCMAIKERTIYRHHCKCDFESDSAYINDENIIIKVNKIDEK